MRKLNNKGFTLVEVIVSCFILLMACLLFLLMSSGTANIINRSVDLRDNGTKASEILEKFELEPLVGNNDSVKFNSTLLPNPISGTFKTVTQGDVTFTMFVVEPEPVTP
ncbi:MAG: prepilin-type N-terminal cleavage/methylation domain-containing protein [Clostridiales bacterium]